VSARLVVAPAAETDLHENFRWYEQRSPGLGLAFLESVEAKLTVIAASPQLFRKRVGDYRLAATPRFPFAIYFIWDEAHALVTVRRILHFKQDRRRRL
jgi:plasmid stabilization system protein ParE